MSRLSGPAANTQSINPKHGVRWYTLSKQSGPTASVASSSPTLPCPNALLSWELENSAFRGTHSIRWPCAGSRHRITCSPRQRVTADSRTKGLKHGE